MRRNVHFVLCVPIWETFPVTGTQLLWAPWWSSRVWSELQAAENTVVFYFLDGLATPMYVFVFIPEKQLESLNSYKVSPSSPNSLDGADLSSIDAMMSAVMNVGKIAENGGNSQNVKSPSKSPAPNRIGRRNQVCKPECREGKGETSSCMGSDKT